MQMARYMTRQEILAEIKRIEKRDGKAPGRRRFENETGLRSSEWYPHLWLRWGDAIKEAGCHANEYRTGFDEEFLIIKYIALIRELGHFPIEGELRIKNKTDKEFPCHNSFSRLGSKRERVQKIIEYCQGKSEFDDIVSLCADILESSPKKPDLANIDSGKIGYVYLIRHGMRNEYKIGKTLNPIRREGEIRLELPEKVQPIHYIKTDDPAGIENYWHSRFASKRKEGEWFSLTPADIRAFKAWKKIC